MEGYKPKPFWQNGGRVALIIFGLNFLLVIANLYLSNGYVTKGTYEADAKDRMQQREQLNTELRSIALELRGIKDHMQGDQLQDKKLDDFESRIRDLEKRR